MSCLSDFNRRISSTSSNLSSRRVSNRIIPRSEHSGPVSSAAVDYNNHYNATTTTTNNNKHIKHNNNDLIVAHPPQTGLAALDDVGLQRAAGGAVPSFKFSYHISLSLSLYIYIYMYVCTHIVYCSPSISYFP